ncbi:hypothetical protein HK405_015550 [Cladochytrium tenue]|nr:hypothetical protein HK405_015550 [Cladochytrium tenue]
MEDHRHQDDRRHHYHPYQGATGTYRDRPPHLGGSYRPRSPSPVRNRYGGTDGRDCYAQPSPAEIDRARAQLRQVLEREASSKPMLDLLRPGSIVNEMDECLRAELDADPALERALASDRAAAIRRIETLLA